MRGGLDVKAGGRGVAVKRSLRQATPGGGLGEAAADEIVGSGDFPQQFSAPVARLGRNGDGGGEQRRAAPGEELPHLQGKGVMRHAQKGVAAEVDDVGMVDGIKKREDLFARAQGCADVVEGEEAVHAVEVHFADSLGEEGGVGIELADMSAQVLHQLAVAVGLIMSSADWVAVVRVVAGSGGGGSEAVEIDAAHAVFSDLLPGGFAHFGLPLRRGWAHDG
ncbi:MAG: hypothetical protein BWX73_00400 [Lentisphaerae bacterium ADurb.Bin082]|nr:MAG: hypothetical protein BWX73_00400 [Lentisphaerae bacterium ADurb.Bin082]